MAGKLKNVENDSDHLKKSENDTARLSQQGLEKIFSGKREKDISSNADLALKTGVSKIQVENVLSRNRTEVSLIREIFVALDLELDEQDLDRKPRVSDILKDRYQSSNDTINTVVQELSETNTNDVQLIASAQITILDSYHEEVFKQAKSSFRYALIVSIVGFVFFLFSTFSVQNNPEKGKVLIPLIGAGIAEIFAGVNFYLYYQANKQLSYFYRKINRTQRYLLANSICGSLEGEIKQKAISELVKTISDLNED